MGCLTLLCKDIVEKRCPEHRVTRHSLSLCVVIVIIIIELPGLCFGVRSC